MERLERVFARSKSLKAWGPPPNPRVLIAYLCVGDPSEEESISLACAAASAGADVLELGVPFSDPTADGPAIARASQRAIGHGGGLASTLRAARAIRAKNPDVPIVLFGYYNPIFVYGEERVVSEAAGTIDALLVVDLPIEEAEPLRRLAAAKGIGLVPLLTPTSSPDRVDAVRRANARHPVGFVYYVSVAGVTGSAAAPLADASVEAGRLRDTLGLPVVVGFGIDSGAKARAAGAHADGVVVGTALVRGIEDAKSREEREAAVRSRVGELRAGLDAC
jgi:tryptophan synthase alpha chain